MLLAFCPITNNCTAFLHVAAHVREVLRFKSFAKPSFNYPYSAVPCACAHESCAFTIPNLSPICLIYARRRFVFRNRTSMLRFQSTETELLMPRICVCVFCVCICAYKLGHFIYFVHVSMNYHGSLIFFIFLRYKIHTIFRTQKIRNSSTQWSTEALISGIYAYKQEPFIFFLKLKLSRITNHFVFQHQGVYAMHDTKKVS